MRAFAVLGVMLAHLALSRFGLGALGVDVFFVLSGFLITWLLIGEHDRTRRVNFAAFYARRTLRLFPALTVLLIVVVIAVLLVDRFHQFQSSTLHELPYTVLYVGNWPWNNLGMPDLLAHTWSLGVEEQFYLIWPAVCVAVLRGQLRRERVAAVLFALAALETIAREFFLHAGGSAWQADRALYFTSDGLLVGAAIAFWLASNHSSLRHPAVKPIVRIGAVVSVIVLLVTIWGSPAFLTHQTRYLPDTAVGSGFVLLSCLTAEVPPLRAALSNRPACWIGRRSYGLYLWNWPIFRMFSTIQWHTRLQHWAVMAAEVTVNFVVAALSWRLVETPFLRVKRRFETDRSLGETTVPVPTDALIADDPSNDPDETPEVVTALT
jgi:peptidoglycan/LPS O-acetylase OafA/YrhL